MKFVLQHQQLVRFVDPMRSHPGNPSSTVAINALWCLLIALTLLTFPLVARQARLASDIYTRRQQSTVRIHTAEPVSPAAKDAALMAANDARR